MSIESRIIRAILLVASTILLVGCGEGNFSETGEDQAAENDLIGEFSENSIQSLSSYPTGSALVSVFKCTDRRPGVDLFIHFFNHGSQTMASQREFTFIEVVGGDSTEYGRGIWSTDADGAIGFELLDGEELVAEFSSAHQIGLSFYGSSCLQTSQSFTEESEEGEAEEEEVSDATNVAIIHTTVIPADIKLEAVAVGSPDNDRTYCVEKIVNGKNRLSCYAQNIDSYGHHHNALSFMIYDFRHSIKKYSVTGKNGKGMVLYKPFSRIASNTGFGLFVDSECSIQVEKIDNNYLGGISCNDLMATANGGTSHLALGSIFNLLDQGM